MFGGTARCGLYAERRTFILLPSRERSFIPPILPRSPPSPSFSSPPVRSTHAEGEATHEISHLCRAHLPRALTSLRYSPLFRPLCPVIQSLSLATSQQPLALLLLSDYCAAVTAMCRFVCIRMIHFLRNISSCATWISTHASA